MVCNAVIPAVEDEATGNPTGISIRLGMTGAIIAITKKGRGYYKGGVWITL